MAGNTQQPKQDQSMQLIFEFEQDTANKKRYQELDSKGQLADRKAAVVDKLYVTKKSMKPWKDPAKLRVTIEPVYE